jgi:hypothetical protein
VTLRTDDLLVPQGTTWRVQWPVQDAAGQPLNLAGYTARAQVREQRDAATTLHEWTTENGGITLADSTVTLIVEPSTSTAWTWTFGRYDLELVSSDGSVTRLTQGTVRVDPEVTR